MIAKERRHSEWPADGTKFRQQKAPSSKLKFPKRLQTPKSEKNDLRALLLDLNTWIFPGAWGLVLGDLWHACAKRLVSLSGVDGKVPTLGWVAQHLPLEHFLIKSRSKAICHGSPAHAHISNV